MVRVITQETYDEVVRENIEEFSMTPGEAVQDAVKQFEAQGVDLSNIIKDLLISEGGDPIKCYLEELASCIEKKDCESVPEVLEKLKTELDKDIAHRVHAAKHGAYNILIDLMKIFEHDVTVVRPALRAVTALMTGHPDLLDDSGIALQKELL